MKMTEFCSKVGIADSIAEISKKLRKISINRRKNVDIFSLPNYNGIYADVLTEREVHRMQISYKKLWILLIEKDISPVTLRKDLSIATGTMTKLRKNEEVALSVLLRICEYLDCNIGDICDAIRDGID